jgi:DNA-directed RNA polymerase subunit K/omega
MEIDYNDFLKRLIDFDGNQYELALVASKRARYLVNNNLLGSSDEKIAVKALYDVLTGKAQIVSEEKED